jgi:hypothetical protein
MSALEDSDSHIFFLPLSPPPSPTPLFSYLGYLQHYRLLAKEALSNQIECEIVSKVQMEVPAEVAAAAAAAEFVWTS